MFLCKRSAKRSNPSVRNRMVGYFFNRLIHRDLDLARNPGISAPRHTRMSLDGKKTSSLHMAVRSANG